MKSRLLGSVILAAALALVVALVPAHLDAQKGGPVVRAHGRPAVPFSPPG